MLRMSVTAKTTLTFSTLVIAALSLAVVLPIVANQKALAANLCGSGFCEPNSGISYPSPLSHFFGGDVLHHHWHDGGSYSHGSLHHHH
jgi:hypothetical protein